MRCIMRWKIFLKKSQFFFIVKVGLCLFLLSSCVSIKKQEKKAKLYHQKALVLIKKCQYPSALAQFKKAIKGDSKNPMYHHSIALLYFQFKEYKKAIQHLKLALKLNPDFTSARVHLGRSLIEIEKYKEGLKELKVAKEDLTYPYKERIHTHIGLAHFKQKNFTLSEKHFNVARTIHKEDCMASFYHAKTFYFLKQYQKALNLLEPAKKWCQTSLALCAKPFFDVYFFSALAYDKIGSRKQALKDMNFFVSKAKKSEYLKQAHQYQKLWK